MNVIEVPDPVGYQDMMLMWNITIKIDWLVSRGLFPIYMELRAISVAGLDVHFSKDESGTNFKMCANLLKKQRVKTSHIWIWGSVKTKSLVW